MRPLALCALLLLPPSLAHGAPRAHTVVVDRYALDPRAPGDGAPILQLPDEVPEPLFLSSTKGRFIVWWRARHGCDKALRASAKLAGDTLTLDVTSRPEARPCRRMATVFETSVEDWGSGPRHVVSDGAAGALASLWFTSPSEARPKEITLLADRVQERAPLRRLGERIAWIYHSEGAPRASIAAYRWLVSLDELHWRAPLYHARLFEAGAFTRTKGGAIASLDALVAGVERLEARISDAPQGDPELDEMKQELAGLKEFLEPALRYLALKWHSEAIHRWHSAGGAYRAYVRLFPTSEDAPLVRFYYASALLNMDDDVLAREQFRLAALGLDDEEKKKLAAACAVVLALQGRSFSELAPCRAPQPEAPPFTTFPEVTTERFARPPDLKE